MATTVTMDDLLRLAVAQNASDVYIKVGIPPVLRIFGQLTNVNLPPLTNDDTVRLATSMMRENHVRQWEEFHETDFAYTLADQGRFRVNVYRQKDTCAAVVRRLSLKIPSFSELGLPPVVEDLANKMRGLVLVTGVAGSGKTTTLAAMVDHINRTRRCHIITIEDPIEIVFQDDKSIVSQREVGQDTRSYGTAMRNVLRETPDVILVGEMRDTETVTTAISAAQTGHLVLSTLHTINAAESINRLMDFFPGSQHVQTRQMIASSLAGIISQRLLTRADGNGRIPAVEIMLATPTVCEYLLDEGKTPQIPSLIAKGGYEGMKTMDQALLELVTQGLVSPAEAMMNAGSAHDLELMLRRGSAVDTE